MSEIINQVIEQATHLPEVTGVDSWRDVLPAASLMATGAYGFYKYKTDHLRQANTAEGMTGADVHALAEAEKTAPTKREHRQKIRAVGLAALSLTFLGADMLNPTYDEQVTNPDGGTAIVIDASHSMRYPQDMEEGTTRLEATYDGVMDALLVMPEDAPKPAIIVATNENEAVVPLNRTIETIDERIGSEATQPNDKANIAPAINLASQLLTESNLEEAGVVVLTDGTVSDVAETQATISSLPEEINLETIIVGTDNGEYNLSGIAGAEVAAATSTDFANGLESNKVHTADSAQDISDQLGPILESRALKTETRPWELFRYAGATAGLLAGIKLIFGKNNRGLRRGPKVKGA